MRLLLILLTLALILAALVLWPQIDLVASGWFYRPADGFFLRNEPLFDGLHFLAHAGSRILGFSLLLLTILAASQRRPVLGFGAKGWLFLLLGLLLGPALVANGIFKDHWGRARPREITEFGGVLHFSPALIPADQCRHNCSFVSGDGAFGFYLPAIAYLMPPPKSRRYFWGGMGLGALFSLARLAAGAHFLSDIFYAAFFVQAVLALLAWAMFGREAVRSRWRDWLFYPDQSKT